MLPAPKRFKGDDIFFSVHNEFIPLRLHEKMRMCSVLAMVRNIPNEDTIGVMLALQYFEVYFGSSSCIIVQTTESGIFAIKRC